MTTFITHQNSMEHAVHHFSAEASEIGLRAGGWPKMISTDLGNGRDFVAVSKKVDADGDIQYVRYVQAAGCIDIVVFND